MIDERVLKSIISTFDDPSFSVFITDISENNECNKDEIIISLEQVTPNLYKLLQTKEYIIDELINLLKTKNITIPNSILNRNKEHIGNIVNKTIVMDSNLAIGEDKNVKSEINGYVDIIGYGETPSQEVQGKIQNGIVEITAKGRPVYLPIDRFKVRANYLYVQLPTNLKDFIVKIDNNVVNHQITDDNILKVQKTNIHLGSHTFNIQYIIDSDITNQNIEAIVTPISKKIEIEFNTPHQNIPSIILTVDKKDTNLYSTYTTSFDYDEENQQYTGVTLEFKNLRRKASYPNINICILGE